MLSLYLPQSLHLWYVFVIHISHAEYVAYSPSSYSEPVTAVLYHNSLTSLTDASSIYRGGYGMTGIHGPNLIEITAVIRNNHRVKERKTMVY